MTLRDFLDASYALLVEDHLHAAPMTDFLTLAQRLVPEDAPTHSAPPPAQIEAQNEASLAALESMLAGVKR